MYNLGSDPQQTIAKLEEIMKTHKERIDKPALEVDEGVAELAGGIEQDVEALLHRFLQTDALGHHFRRRQEAGRADAARDEARARGYEHGRFTVDTHATYVAYGGSGR